MKTVQKVVTRKTFANGALTEARRMLTPVLVRDSGAQFVKMGQMSFEVKDDAYEVHMEHFATSPSLRQQLAAN